MKLIVGDVGEYSDWSGRQTDKEIDHAKEEEEDVRLFNLSIDPRETANLASEYPEIVANLTQRLKEIEKSAIPPHTSDNVLEGNPNLNGGFFGTGWCDL